MIGDTGYRFENLDPTFPEDMCLVKVTVVDPATVDISCDSEGILEVTEKLPEFSDDDETEEVPAVPVEPGDLGNGKYRLVREGDLFRLVATCDIPGTGVYKGAFGGRVGSSETLSRHGKCWVHNGSVVRGDISVDGDAQIYDDCTLDGHGHISGGALLRDVTFTGTGYLEVNGDAELNNVAIDGGYQVHIGGSGFLQGTRIEAVAGDVRLFGCKVRGGHIRNGFEVVSIYDTKWGWLSAYRNKSGVWQFSIGCQDPTSAEELRTLAAGDATGEVKMAMLEGFFAVVDAARAGWHHEPQAASQHVELGFTGMAQRARDAAQTLQASGQIPQHEF